MTVRLGTWGGKGGFGVGRVGDPDLGRVSRTELPGESTDRLFVGVENGLGLEHDSAQFRIGGAGLDQDGRPGVPFQVLDLLRLAVCPGPDLMAPGQVPEGHRMGPAAHAVGGNHRQTLLVEEVVDLGVVQLDLVPTAHRCDPGVRGFRRSVSRMRSRPSWA